MKAEFPTGGCRCPRDSDEGEGDRRGSGPGGFLPLPLGQSQMTASRRQAGGGEPRLLLARGAPKSLGPSGPQCYLL